MKPYTFHIDLFDLAFAGTIFIGLTFALQLWFSKRINQAANRFLAVALVVVALWIARVAGIDIGLSAYVPNWDRLPLKFSLALGPLIFFYVLKLTRPEYKFRWKDSMHFIPVLLELAIQLYGAPIFRQLSPVFQVLAFTSVSIYLYLSHRLIERFYERQKFNYGDRCRNELSWLHRLLLSFGLLWLLWIPYVAADYFVYHNRSGPQVYYSLYLALSIAIIVIGAVAFIRLEANGLSAAAPVFKPLLPAELKQKAAWLKKTVKEKRYYEEPELSLSSLAEKLGLHTHELSRIINTALKKSFNDFINEYRVA
ncbi:MAG TPA: hypothetical protein VGM63_00835, partial [Mucilaginibacter sp.]